jgi:hypothetical protein
MLEFSLQAAPLEVTSETVRNHDGQAAQAEA